MNLRSPQERASRLGWRLLLCLAMLLSLASVTARAAQSPAAGATLASDAVTAGIRETVLPNGLKVLTKEVRNAPVVAFQVWYRVGSRNEHTGITGVSHLLEHMLFKGTKKYRVGEISRTLFVNGASFNASTYYDWTNYYETLASDRLEMAMELEADRMLNSTLDANELASEMTVVRSELEGGENNPGQLLYRSVAAAAFQAHPYQWPVIGWRSDVENVSRDAMYQYYKTYYGPNNAVIVMVGDFETEKALAMVRKHFGKLKRIPEPPKVHTQEPPQRGERRVTVRRAGSLPMVLIGFRNPPAEHPDMYALDALSMILGEGRTSRLYQSMVETQLASSAEASNPSLKDGFLFEVSATARPGKTADELEKALLEQIERVKKEPVTQAELDRVKRQLEAQFIYQNDSVTAQANQIGYWEMAVSWRYLSTYLDKIRALTPADLQRVAQKYLVTEASTVGHFIPTEGGAPAAPAPREASARVEKPKAGDRPVPLPKPSKTAPAKRNVTRFRLDNGMTVIVQENPVNATVALTGSLNAGSVFEPQEKPGVAALTAAMLSRGTKERSALEFAEQLESVGASLSASADTLTTNVNGSSLSRDFNRILDLLAEMLQQPAFPAADLERLKGQVLAGLESQRTNPDSLANRAFERALYPEGHPLRPKTLDEAIAAVQSITRDDLVRFYQQQYGPESMILVIAGDVKAGEVRQALQQRFGSWPKNVNAKPLPADLSVDLGAKGERVAINVPDMSEVSIMWGHAGLLKRSDPEFYAAQVMNMILGGGGALNSRLGNVIRDQQGLAYSVFSFFDSGLYAGPFQVMLGTNPANADKALQSLNEQIRQMREKGVTQREVDESVAYLTGRFPQRLETNAGMASLLWSMEFYDLGEDYIDKYGDYYRAVTVEQVNAAAKKYLHPDRAITSLAGTLPGAVQ